MFNVLDQHITDDYSLYLGDSCEVLQNFPDESFDLSVYSPPFQSLFSYTPSARDLGNSKTKDDFFGHYKFVIQQLLRITKPGRVTAVHVADIAANLTKDGYIGLKDFSGDVIRLYEKEGWVLNARVPIDKNQQIAAIRTHSKGLTMIQMEKDRTWSSPAMPDYILKFRKPGENKVPVSGGFSGDVWIEYANPTWTENDFTSKVHYFNSCLQTIKRAFTTEQGMIKTDLTYSEVGTILKEIEKNEKLLKQNKGEVCFNPFDGIDRCADVGAHETWFGIKETEVIQGAFDGREEKDEKHIAPLQLETIRRCIELWSNPGEVILDPFSGVGSTVYMALKSGRKAVGIELKESWYKQAIRNIERLYNSDMETLF
jgi:DNA modification methylase